MESTIAHARLEGQRLENAIAARSAPKVTKDQIEGRIDSVSYHRLGATTTLCFLALDNGYSVLGHSACVNPQNYDEQIGQSLAYEDAVRQLWPLFGFELAERQHQKALSIDQNRARIARVCHEINREYCRALGDDSQPAWEEAPDWQVQSAIEGVAFHLANPDAGPEASHANWLETKRAGGWEWGEVKDPEQKTHPCMVPFDELPPEQRAKDFLFRATVHALARHRLA